MPFLTFSPAMLGFLLLGLHFFRSDNLPALGLSLLLVGLLFVRRPWVVRTLQFSLLLGAMEWIRTALLLVAARKEMGAPFLRLAFILGGVALLTALAALVFQTAKSKIYFRLD